MERQGHPPKGRTKDVERWLSWSKAHDWKSCNVSKAFWGSNPHLSARNLKQRCFRFFVLFPNAVLDNRPAFRYAEKKIFLKEEHFMAASKKKRTGARAAVVVVLCLVLVCVVAAAVALGLVSRRVKRFAGGAAFRWTTRSLPPLPRSPLYIRCWRSSAAPPAGWTANIRRKPCSWSCTAGQRQQPAPHPPVHQQGRDAVRCRAALPDPAQQHHRQLSAGRYADPGMEYGQLHLPDPAGQPAGRG